MFKRFIRDASGQFAIYFAIGVSMLLMGVGVAIDYAGLSSQASKMQNIADSAVLAAAKSLETDRNKLKRIAKKTVEENNHVGIPITTKLKLKKNVIRVELNANYNTTIWGIFGKKHLPAVVYAEAPLATSDPLNISLVLDVTGSMSGANITSLKSSTTKLLTTMERFKNDKIKVAIVPFANYVALDPGTRNKRWMDVPADYKVVHDEVCNTYTPVISKSGCTSTTTTSTYPPSTTYNDGVPTTRPGGTSTHTSETCTNYEYGPEQTSCYTPAPTEYKWFGLVGSRTGGKHKEAKFGGTKIPGFLENVAASRIAPATVLPLTKNIGTAKSKINSLVANGETYIPSGLMWGWRTLDTDKPFTQAAGNQGPRAINAMVVMTDGTNTRSLTAPRHDGYDGNAADDLSAELCESIKKDAIIIYTVAYRFPAGGNAGTRKMLEKCASNAEMFFKANNPKQLEQAFDEIAQSLYSTRISH